jgi:drug/metabolite transporter (DMT)-like permease
MRGRASEHSGEGRQDVLRAALFMLAATTCVAVDAGLIRLTSQALHPFEIAFFRNLFSLALILPWLWRAGPSALRTRRLGLHLLRAALKLVAICALFFAISVLPLADVTAIAFTAPLFVTLGAWLFMSERLPASGWLAIFVGFAGVLIVLRPGAAVFDPFMLVALLAAVGQASIMLLLKLLAGKEPTITLVGLNLVLSVPLALAIAIPFWAWPSPFMLGLLLAQGALGALGQTAVTRAMALADASTIMPIEFVRLPLVVLIGWLAFGEPSDLFTWLGGAVIFASTLYLVRRSHAARPA